jgi:hypothetical protein
MVCLLMDLRDRWAPSGAQAPLSRRGCDRPLAFAFALAVATSCGENRPPPPAAPHSAPARDVIVRTGRFAIHVNAYVQYYARAVAADRGAASETSSPPRLDADLASRLGACSDDACAKAALTGTSYAEGLDGYLHDTWADDSDEARRAVGLSGTPLMAFEDLLAPALAAQIGRVWPNEPVDVYLARAPGVDPSGREGAVIDTQGECFGASALLECLFTRGVEVLLPESDLGRGIEAARAALDESSRKRTEAAAPCIAALAVDAAVTATDPRYRPTRRFDQVCDPNVRAWLGTAWAKRMKGDLAAREFGTQLVEAMVTLPSQR